MVNSCFSAELSYFSYFMSFLGISIGPIFWKSARMNFWSLIEQKHLRKIKFGSILLKLYNSCMNHSFTDLHDCALRTDIGFSLRNFF